MSEFRERGHGCYVQFTVKGKCFAVCRSCGSDSFPDRDTVDEAEADITAHGGSIHHIMPRDELVSWVNSFKERER